MADGPAIGTRIARRRQVLGMTQQQLADALGVSKSTVANWEAGKHFPLRKLGKVEAVLGISLDDPPPPPRIPAGLQRMVDALSEEEREALLAELTGRPAAPALPARRGRESA